MAPSAPLIYSDYIRHSRCISYRSEIFTTIIILSEYNKSCTTALHLLRMLNWEITWLENFISSCCWGSSHVQSLTSGPQVPLSSYPLAFLFKLPINYPTTSSCYSAILFLPTTPAYLAAYLVLESPGLQPPLLRFRFLISETAFSNKSFIQKTPISSWAQPASRQSPQRQSFSCQVDCTTVQC